jgi:hypothetical protein
MPPHFFEMEDKKRRTKNFCDYEKNLLQELVKSHQIILSKAKDTKTAREKEKAWTSMVAQFNSDEKVSKRDEDSLKNAYRIYFNVLRKN